MGVSDRLSDEALDLLFREARTFGKWHDRDVSDDLIEALYTLLKFGPTAANTCPARFVFVKSKEAKEKLKPHLDAGNVEKTMSAPVTAIIGYDLKFYEQMGKLFPHAPDAINWYKGNDEKIRTAAFQGSTLQGAYLIMAARSLGLDCGPMGGFNADGVKEAFFPGQDIVPNFLCNIGYGDRASLYPRSPRLSFDEAAQIL